MYLLSFCQKLTSIYISKEYVSSFRYSAERQASLRGGRQPRGPAGGVVARGAGLLVHVAKADHNPQPRVLVSCQNAVLGQGIGALLQRNVARMD